MMNDSDRTQVAKLLYDATTILLNINHNDPGDEALMKVIYAMELLIGIHRRSATDADPGMGIVEPWSKKQLKEYNDGLQKENKTQ